MIPKIYGAELLKKHGPRFLRVPVARWSWRPRNPAEVSRMWAGAIQYPYALHTNYKASNKKQKVVLIFDAGAMAKGLIYWLKRYKLKFFYFDYEQFILRRGGVTFSTDSKYPDAAISFGAERLLLSDVAAVFWAPPEISRKNTATKKNLQFDLFLSRWQQILRDLSGVFRHAVWLPGTPLVGAPEYQNKFAEYLYAKDLGLKVPDCIFTNEVVKAKAFMKKWRGRVLFRDFSQEQRHYKIGFASDCFTYLHKAPCVFQQYIEKQYEIRAVVVGSRVFACRIDSQSSDLAKMDWRVYDDAYVKWDRIVLPGTLRRRIVTLVQDLGLTFASVDMIKSTDGHYYFLEVNRPGACYWLKPYVGLDIARELIRFIRTKI